MTRRIQLNLAVFALLGVILSVWALRTVLKFDALLHPYRISAQFASSPGLQPGFDVTYLGVAVGKIHSVRLDGSKVVVQFSINKGERIPHEVTAAAALKSAIGEPYVDLEPAPGASDSSTMRPGDVIPLSRTSVSLTYGDLFGEVNKAISGLNPNDLHTITHELALGLDGRGDSLRQSVDGASLLAGTFARNTDTLNGLITNVTSLTQVLANRRGDLAAGINSTASLTSSLAEVDASLAQIRDTTPSLLTDASRLLRESKPAAICALHALSAATPTLLSPSNVSALDKGLSWAPQLSVAMAGVITYVNGDPNLNLKFTITPGPVSTAPENRNLAPLPTIPPIPVCTGVTLPAVQIPPMKTASAAKSGTPAAATAPPISTRNSADGRYFDPHSWLVYTPPIVAALVLIGVAVRAFGPAWRLKRRRRRQ